MRLVRHRHDSVVRVRVHGRRPGKAQATVGQRIAGIRREMAERGLRFAAEESCRDWELRHGYDATRALLEHRGDLRALLCMNDRLAFGAYQALADRGLSVPRNISVVSFDNDELASYLRPGLTTVALPHEAMGRTSVELLLDRGRRPDCHLIPMPVVGRGSVRPPAG
ncbi:substrate-binding domain-containing protein [Streptomyces sp. NPDC088747]|uniref:substrate-binding domain-containing protein n=1 Tax=Streptomyces sp. NPDC088747 TaxID=3365886 RepID=UPI0037F5098C